ncbi:unnamed protein product [Nyctereutes procyonoides]|uniref:(raccoon dog) hypothetical protein n=1 Tax=Nyctereutes procyonoides TaxID=34880 RepID=A0A811ZYS9_NYCPR|nr:unnamed protein product [Nyctereutes procyonoides]
MGSSKSTSVIPVRPLPHNKLLARVADPCSRTASNLRTPIQQEDPNQAQDSDPRSPTLGIARTPMKTSSRTELPYKQVSSKEEARQPSETPTASQGSKQNRQKTNGKVLGRSPLTILQDDNSPGTLPPRQDLGRLLKTGGQVWEQDQDQDKKNQHLPNLVEN